MNNDEEILKKLITIKYLKRETIGSNSVITIKIDGKFSCYFNVSRKLIISNSFIDLLDKIIKYLLTNRYFIKDSINKTYSTSPNKYTKVRKYKLINKR